MEQRGPRNAAHAALIGPPQGSRPCLHAGHVSSLPSLKVSVSFGLMSSIRRNMLMFLTPAQNAGFAAGTLTLRLTNGQAIRIVAEMIVGLHMHHVILAVQGD